MEREKLIEYIEMGLSTRKIAAAENTSQINVRYWLKKYNLKTSPCRKVNRYCKLCGKPVDRPANKHCRECLEKPVSLGMQLLAHVPFDEIKTERRRKSRLLLERGHRCEKCGLTEWLGEPIKLEMHHVNGDADNNSRENLQLLCLNCHAQTSTFRAKNKASPSRRKLYRKKYYET